jgi:hypothetical protein
MPPKKAKGKKGKKKPEGIVREEAVQRPPSPPKPLINPLRQPRHDYLAQVVQEA